LLKIAIIDILNSKRIGVTSLTFHGSRYVISRVTIWYPTSQFVLVVLCNPAAISNGFWEIQWRMWHDLDTASKQRSRSFIMVPIDFSYTTSYRLSIVTFASGRTDWPQYIPYRRQTVGDGRNTVA